MKELNYSKGQLSTLVISRMAVGWYMLYQGVQKYYDPGWTSEGFLSGSGGPFSGIFHAMANNEGVIAFVDILNTYGQLAIGSGLIMGIFTPVALISGMVMMGLYYVAQPPFMRWGHTDSELIINTQLILFMSLLVLYKFPTHLIVGVDKFIFGSKEK